MRRYSRIASFVAMLSGLCCVASQSGGAAEFDETRARSLCQREANKIEARDTVRQAAIAVCVGEERRSADQVEYKRRDLKQSYRRGGTESWDDIYVRCARANEFYQDISECIDRAVLALPRQSIFNTFRLQHGLKEERLFWNIEDCNAARREEPGSVCVGN